MRSINTGTEQLLVKEYVHFVFEYTRKVLSLSLPYRVVTELTPYVLSQKDVPPTGANCRA